MLAYYFFLLNMNTVYRRDNQGGSECVNCPVRKWNVYLCRGLLRARTKLIRTALALRRPSRLRLISIILSQRTALCHYSFRIRSVPAAAKSYSVSAFEYSKPTHRSPVFWSTGRPMGTQRRPVWSTPAP